MIEIGRRTVEKLRILASYLERVHGITLARAISLNPAKMHEVLSGKEQPSYKLCVKVAAYFFIPVEILTDDTKELPEEDLIQIDADLLSV